MPHIQVPTALLAAASALAAGLGPPPAGAQEPLPLAQGDVVVLVGGTFVEREQRDGWIELALTLAAPGADVTYRNLGWSGDTVEGRARRFFGPTEDGFRHLLAHLELVAPTVLLVSYGTSEAFDAAEAADPAPLRAAFLAGYGRLLDALGALPAPPARVVLVGAPPLEPARSPAPELARRVNAELARQGAAVRELARGRGLRYVDLHAPLTSLAADGRAPGPLTDNGLHLTPLGYQLVARELLAQLGLGSVPWRAPGAAAPGTERTGEAVPVPPPLERLRAAIRAKNEVFLHRHRPQNETYLRGFRRNEQGRHAVEIEAFGPLTRERDEALFALRAAATREEAGR